MFMLFITLIALAMVGLGAILTWAGGPWWFLGAALVVVWLFWSIGRHPTRHPQALHK
jgi:hypothetical protein